MLDVKILESRAKSIYKLKNIKILKRNITGLREIEILKKNIGTFHKKRNIRYEKMTSFTSYTENMAIKLPKN